MADLTSQDVGQAAEDKPRYPGRLQNPGPCSLDLEYPELPLHLSLDSLLAHSSSSSSGSSSRWANMPPPEVNPGNLDDSWASLNDDEFSTEDDLQSENTDVGSLLDVHSSDDIHSVTDGIHLEETELTDEEELGDTLKEESGSEHISRQGSRRESPAFPLSPISQRDDRKEESAEESMTSALSTYRSGRELTEAELQRLRHIQLNDNGSTKYFSVIQMPVFKSSLDLNTHSHFKVLLLGRQVEQFRPEIQRKLGDILVSQTASSSSSSQTSITRFHLVPNTFGPGAEPDFADLVAIDKEIEFDCYDRITSSSASPQPATLSLRNSLTRSKIVSKWHGSSTSPLFVVDNVRWTIPDLAIICVHLDEDHLVDSESHHMITFTKRHGIPRVLIRMDRGWNGSYIGALDADSLHESIEPQHKQSRHRPSLKFPVDMAAFLNLDSGLLNRHLAYAVPTAEKDRLTAEEEFKFSNTVEAKLASDLDSLTHRGSSFRKHGLIVLWVLCVYMLIGRQIWPIYSDPASGADSGDIMSPVGTQQQFPTSESSPQAPSATPYNSGTLSMPSYQVLDVASISVAPAMSDDALHFQVGISGDSQLLIKLPKIALGRRKRSMLVVDVRRKNHTIPAAVQELFDGVFSVQLLPHDAVGDVEVNLSMSKPQLNETLTVSFGGRHDFELPPLRGLLRNIQNHFQGTVANMSISLKDVHRTISDSCHALASQAQNRLNGCRPYDQVRMHTILRDLASWKPYFSTIQSAHDGIAQRKQEFLRQWQMLAAGLSAGYSDAHLRFFDSVACSLSQVGPNLGMGITEKLKNAQGGAQYLLSNAATLLGARN